MGEEAGEKKGCSDVKSQEKVGFKPAESVEKKITRGEKVGVRNRECRGHIRYLRIGGIEYAEEGRGRCIFFFSGGGGGVFFLPPQGERQYSGPGTGGEISLAASIGTRKKKTSSRGKRERALGLARRGRGKSNKNLFIPNERGGKKRRNANLTPFDRRKRGEKKRDGAFLKSQSGREK